MKKKSIWSLILAICLFVPVLLMMTACGNDKHKHTFSSDWTKTDTEHYHVATCEHSDMTSEKGLHTFGDWSEKTPAGVHTDKVEKRTCTVCEFEETRPVANSALHEFGTDWEYDETNHWHRCSCSRKSDETAHEFGSWTTKTEAGFHQNRVEERKCNVCDHSEERTIADTETHTFANSWSRNNTQHWKDSTCKGHTTLQSEVADHTFNEWSEKTPAGYGVNKVDKRTCTVCEFEETREGSALSPKTNTISVDEFHFTYNGKSQSIEDLITANNTLNMVIKYVGTGTTTYEESTTAPTNAGSYSYTITIPATAEWEVGTITDSFVISKYRVTCPSVFVTSLVGNQTDTDVLYEFTPDEGEIEGVEEIILTYKNGRKGAGRMNVSTSSIQIPAGLESNIELIGLPTGNIATVEWIVKDETEALGFYYHETITIEDKGSYYKGYIQHGTIEVGKEYTLFNYNDTTNSLSKILVRVKEIMVKLSGDSGFRTTRVATKGEIIAITIEKINSSDVISSVNYIVLSTDLGVINKYQNSQTSSEMSFDGREYRMFKINIDTTEKIKLSITNKETCEFVKVFDANTGAEISLVDDKFQLSASSDILIVIRQTASKGSHQVKLEKIEYTIAS